MHEHNTFGAKGRERKYDVTALGELLIDFTENGLSGQGNFLFEANPGGAPCNVLAMLAKLGRRTAFIGKVGDDFLGRHLKEVVCEAGIDTERLLMDSKVHTTLAFVHTAADGDRDFSFYRNPGADMCLRADEIDETCEALITESKIFHFGSLSMTHPVVREATAKALAIAREAGCLISFDPNLREPLWESHKEAREQIAYGMGWCDILKISDNEIRWFTGKQDFDEGVRVLRKDYGIPLILLSMGREGSRAYYDGGCCRDLRRAALASHNPDCCGASRDSLRGSIQVEAAAYLQKKTIETTGAGDTFCACVLHYILEHGLVQLTENQLREMLSFAGVAAAIITTRKGALKVMPSRQEVEALLKKENSKKQ